MLGCGKEHATRPDNQTRLHNEANAKPQQLVWQFRNYLGETLSRRRAVPAAGALVTGDPPAALSAAPPTMVSHTFTLRPRTPPAPCSNSSPLFVLPLFLSRARSLAVLHRGHQRERLRRPMGAARAHQRSSGRYPPPPPFSLIVPDLPSPENFSGFFLQLLGGDELGLLICGKQCVGSIVFHLTKLSRNCPVKPPLRDHELCSTIVLLFGVLLDRVESRKSQH